MRRQALPADVIQQAQHIAAKAEIMRRPYKLLLRFSQLQLLARLSSQHRVLFKPAAGMMPPNSRRAFTAMHPLSPALRIYRRQELSAIQPQLSRFLIQAAPLRSLLSFPAQAQRRT